MGAIRAMIALAALGQATQASTEAEVQFVSCPVYRDADAGKKSGCWLTDDRASGVRSDVSQSANKPDWNFAILVEGKRAADQTDVCGGVVLDPVRVSTLDQPCIRAMIPGEGYMGRKFVLPKRNVRPLYEARTPAPKPWQPRTFVIPFDLNKDFMVYQLADYLMDQAILYALDVGPAKIEITGYADTRKRMISGTEITEDMKIAEARAIRAREWLKMRGVDMTRTTLKWEAARQDSDDEAFDGLVGPSRRMAKIVITPLG
jgi:hypothetical protein